MHIQITPHESLIDLPSFLTTDVPSAPLDGGDDIVYDRAEDFDNGLSSGCLTVVDVITALSRELFLIEREDVTAEY